MSTDTATTTRFHVEPSGLLDGWWAVHDAETGMLAKSAKRVIFRDKGEADTMAERLNRELKRKAICRACRRRVLAVTVFNGQCKECRS